MRIAKITILFTVAFQLGCSNGFGRKLKAFLGGKSAPVARSAKPKPSQGPRFSQSPNYGFNFKRKYTRTTRGKMERDSQLHSSAGSLWVNEGQGSYLFTQNILRRPGDILNIQVDGAPKKQLETKVRIIKKLIRRMRAAAQPKRRLASAKSGKDKEKKKEKGKEGGDKKAPNNQNQANKQQPEKEVNGTFDVEFVPARIVERLTDGNYRVKGSQAFMIGKREYKVIITGIVKGDDFNDEGIRASQLLDPQFDVVTNRKNVQL